MKITCFLHKAVVFYDLLKDTPVTSSFSLTISADYRLHAGQIV